MNKNSKATAEGVAVAKPFYEKNCLSLYGCNYIKSISSFQHLLPTYLGAISKGGF